MPAPGAGRLALERPGTFPLPSRWTVAALGVVAVLAVPVVAVLGNHDFESGHEQELMRMMIAEGIKVLDGSAYERDGVGFARVKTRVGQLHLDRRNLRFELFDFSWQIVQFLFFPERQFRHTGFVGHGRRCARGWRAWGWSWRRGTTPARCWTG